MGLPTPVTFLLTDIEGSTALWQQDPDATFRLQARHDGILQDAIAAHSGDVPLAQGEGDSAFAVFDNPEAAVTCALDIQRALLAEPWPQGMVPRTRMGIHTGSARRRSGNYFGVDISRCARIRSAAHGGQVLLSQATLDGISAWPAGASVRDLGRHRLKDLALSEQIYQLCHPDIPSDFPAPRSLELVRHNLPASITDFIGRGVDLDETARAVRSQRLVTLAGVGGAGKTRLAIEVAQSLVDDFKDGVWLTDFSALSSEDGGLVAQQLASALGIVRDSSLTDIQGVLEHLRTRQTLVLLDNCEHVLAAVDELVLAILSSCPAARVLATSREPLGLPGERVVRIAGLTLPPEEGARAESILDYEAPRLFVSHARARRPTIDGRASAPAIAKICRALDGLPLALEIAAAAMDAFTPEQLLAQLEDRFRLIQNPNRAAPERQQSLERLISWSYDLLEDEEQTLLGRLSVFAGGWNEDAALAVCTDDRVPEEHLSRAMGRLVGKSLVVADALPVGARYRMLETLREFGMMKAEERGETKTLRSRHRGFFQMLVLEAKEHLQGQQQATWLEVLDEEHDNIRSAITSALDDGDSETALMIANGTAWFWEMRGFYREGARWLAKCIEATDTSPDRVQAMITAGRLTFHDGEVPRAIAWLERAAEDARLLDDQSLIAWSLHNLTMLPATVGHRRALEEEALAAARQAGDEWMTMAALNGLGYWTFEAADYSGADELWSDALDRARHGKNRMAESIIVCNMARCALATGDKLRARALASDALSMSREIGFGRGTLEALTRLAATAQSEGQIDEAKSWIDAALIEIERSPEQSSIFAAEALLHSGCVKDALGDREGSRADLSKALELSDRLSFHEGIVGALSALGSLERKDGNYPEAEAHLRRIARLHEELGVKHGVGEPLKELAACLREQGREAEAAPMERKALELGVMER